jgi:sugar phosphate isomerase/epimerase
MPRSIHLFTNSWSDLPLEEVASKAAEWGYQGLEICCWGDHFEIQRALDEESYCTKKLDLLARHDLAATVLACHRIGQAVGDRIDERHRALLPDYVWGDGDPDEVSLRAAEEMRAAFRAAQKMGMSVVSGFVGSKLSSYVAGWPPPTPEVVRSAFADFAHRWNPLLDVCRDCGLRFAFEVHPGQIAFDLYTAEQALDALGGREEFGFTFDPSHLHWQGVDPVQFVRRFPERIFHVHIKDAALTLDGRSGILNSYFSFGDARRGWDFRSPGHGGLDWAGIIRALNDIGYEGPLSVDWRDPGMSRDWGADDACKFLRRLDFDRA